MRRLLIYQLEGCLVLFGPFREVPSYSLPLHCNVSCCAPMTPPKLCDPADSSKNSAAHQAALKQ